MLKVFRGLLVALLCVGSAVYVYGQSAVDGAIGGTVQDATGSVIPGATVVIHENATNAEQKVVADSAGLFRAVHLQPSTYTVTVTAQGFGTFKANQVVVEVGLLTDLSPKLSAGGTSETVNVTGEAPVMNTTSPDFANVINQNILQNLPVSNYRWSSYALLTPGVVNDANGFGLLSFRGQSTLLNNVTFDGVDDNQAYFSEERGRTRAGYSTAKASVQEFQVNTSNYSSEYGRSAGGVVNSITKSGSNQFHGEGYYYDRDSALAAQNPFTAKSVQTTPGGPFTSVGFKPTDIRKQYGGAIGGAIIKDKLFFFFAADDFYHYFPAVAVSSNPGNFFTTPATTLPAGQVCGTTGATAPSAANALACQLLANEPGLGSYTNAANYYINGLNGLNTLLGTVPRIGSQTVFFPKVDWQINAKNHASFELNRLRWISPAGIQTGATVTDGVDTFGNDYVRDTFGVAKLDSVITSHISNEARYQYGRDFEFEFGQTPSQYEATNVSASTAGYSNPFGNIPPEIFITNGLEFGTPTFLERAALPDERRWQTADTVNWIHGHHSFKFGGDYIHTDDRISNLASQYGNFNYPSLTNYLSDLYQSQQTTAAAKSVFYSSYVQAFGPAGLEFTTGDFGFFGEDDWKVTPRLSVVLGARYEYEKLPATPNAFLVPSLPQVGFTPSNKGNIGPRVGFSYDAFGTGKTVLRGGYGIFFARVINSTIEPALIGTGSPNGQQSFTFTATSLGHPTFPQVIPTVGQAGAAGGTPASIYFDPNFKLPQIQQADLTVEQDMGWHTVFSASWLGTLGRRLPDFEDTNLPTPTAIAYTVIDSSGKGPLAAGSTVTEQFFQKNATNCSSGRPNCAFGSITDIVSGVNSNYQALVAQVAHQLNHNIQFNANYTWSHALDFGENNTAGVSANGVLTPNNLRAEYGNSNQNVPNRFVINAVATSPWHFARWASYLLNDYEFSPSFQAQNGLPYSFGTTGTLATGFTSTGAQVSAVGGGVNGSGGTARVPGIDRNVLKQPGTQVFDVRLSKRFVVAERVHLEFLAESFNLFNHQNVTSVNTTAYAVSDVAASKQNTLTFQTQTANPTLPLFGTVTSTNNSGFAYAQRQVQFSVRAQF